MPSEYKLKVSITEYTLSLQGDLLFRGRRWVPSTDNLRTRIIQQTHDSVIRGHLRREAIYAFIARQFFWLGMSKDIKDFTDAYDGCGRNKS